MEKLPWYLHSNVVALNLLDTCKSANPQLVIVWPSSSSFYVYGLNSISFSEDDCTEQPASNYAATRKAGENTHTDNPICGHSITGLRIFTNHRNKGR